MIKAVTKLSRAELPGLKWRVPSVWANEFTENVKASYDDIENVTWRDENILYIIERTG